MSIEMHVLVADRVPERSEWQAAIDALGIPLQLDPELNVVKDSGYSPCKLRGEDSGFELSDEPTPDLLDAFPTLASAAPAQVAKAITFRWGGDMKECACVLGAAAGLLSGFSAVAYYPADDILYDLDTLKSEFASALADAKRSRARR
jgi:hypothetical protein